MTNRSVITTGILLLGISVCAQTPERIDSLRNVDISTPIERVQVYNQLCWEYRFINADTARDYGLQAIELSLASDYTKGLAEAYSNVGITFEAQGEYDSALNYHKRALAVKQNLNDTLELAGTLNNMGIAYDELGNHVEALEHYFTALRYYENGDDPLQIAKVLCNIGVVYRKQKEFEKVLEYYNRAYQLYRDNDSMFGETVLQGNIGVVYINLKDYEKALEYTDLSLRGYEVLGLNQYIPYAEFNKAIVFDSLHQFDSAEYFYLRSIEQFETYKNQHELANTSAHLAKLYLKTGQFNEGQLYAQKSVDLSQDIQARDVEIRGLEILGDLLAANGNYSRAYSTLKKKDYIKDTLYEAEKTKQIFELQTKYETEKKELEIANQKLEMSEMNASLERNRNLILGLSLILGLIIFIGWLLRKRYELEQEKKFEQQKTRSKAEQLQAVISSQEEERRRFAMDLHDGFGQFISSLKMNLSRLESLEKNQYDARDRIVNESEEILTSMHQEIRNVAFNLMPTTLTKEGLEPALIELSSRWTSSGKVIVKVMSFELNDRLSSVLEISLYRIIQEWINNIIKYNDADLIEIQLVKDKREIRVSVEDNGQGFDPNILDKSKGHGWRNINSRLNLIKGYIDIDSNPGRKGTSVFITIPIEFSDVPSESTHKTDHQQHEK